MQFRLIESTRKKETEPKRLFAIPGIAKDVHRAHKDITLILPEGLSAIN